MLHAATLARLARDVARVTKASDVTQRKALALEVEAKIRVTDEYEAAQAAGEAATNRGEVKPGSKREGAQASAPCPPPSTRSGLRDLQGAWRGSAD